MLLALISMFSSWTLDERADAVITPEIQAQIDEVKRAADAGEIEPGVAATEIQVIRASAQTADRIVVDGKSSAGPGLGIWTLALSAAGGVAALVCAGVAGLDDRRRWVGGTLAMGFGVGVTLLAVGWVGSLTRATNPNFYTGVGALIGGLAGVVLFAAGSSIVGGFERSKVYGDLVLPGEGLRPTDEPRRVAVPGAV
jgi:hypothetical protein